MKHYINQLDKILKQPNDFIRCDNIEYLLLRFKSVCKRLEDLQISNNAPFVCPTNRESIQLEFWAKFGNYLELEIFKDKITMLKIMDNQEIEIDVDEDTAVEEVSRFINTCEF